MPSHRGSRARGYRMEDTGSHGRVRSGRGERAGRRRSLVRFWPAMALLAVSLLSAWLVGAVNSGNAQDLIFAGTGSAAEAGRNAPAAEQPPAGGDRQPADADDQQDEVVDTATGPLTTQDREILTKVHLASLWQRPAAAAALDKATGLKVKDAAKRIAAEQATVAKQAKSVAAQLDIQLPAQPSAEQQKWMTELGGKTGTRYDQLFVDRLRAAQGKLFPLVGQARATTQNDLIRAFAQATSTTILRNMTFLERTGLVGPSSLGGSGSPTSGGGSNPDAPTAGGQEPGDPAPAEGDAGAEEGDLIEGDDLGAGETLNDGEANGAGDPAGGGNQPPARGAPNNSTNPSTPDSPLDLPQGNLADDQAGSVATTPTSSILGAGSDGTGKYIIILMLAVAALIFLTAMRGLYRPR